MRKTQLGHKSTDDPLWIDKAIEEGLGGGQLEEVKTEKGNAYHLTKAGLADTKALLHEDSERGNEARAMLFTLTYNDWVKTIAGQLDKPYGIPNITVGLLKLEKRLAEEGIDLLGYLETLLKEAKRHRRPIR